MYFRTGLGASLSDLAAAIQRFEGACSGPTTCTNNNPGNLRAGPGQVGTDSRGFAIFPDYATGEAALLNQVNLNVGRGLSLSEFFGGKPGVYPGYAPAADANNPTGYASTVAGWLGIDPSAPLQSALSDSGPAPSSGTGPIFDSSAPGDGSGPSDSTGLLVGLGVGAAVLLALAVS